jgi:hypothetical protein
MIFGTANFVTDVTGKRLQVCFCDAKFPDGTVSRILLYADAGNGYYLGDLADRYEMKTKGDGKNLTVTLTPKNVIEIRNERPEI